MAFGFLSLAIAGLSLSGCKVDVDDDTGTQGDVSDIAEDTEDDTTTPDTGEDTTVADTEEDTTATDTGEDTTTTDTSDTSDTGPELVEQVLAYTPSGVDPSGCQTEIGFQAPEEKQDTIPDAYWSWYAQSFQPDSYPFELDSVQYVVGHPLEHTRSDLAHRAKLWVLSADHDFDAMPPELPNDPAGSSEVLDERTIEIPEGDRSEDFRTIELTSEDFGDPITLEEGQTIAVAIQTVEPDSYSGSNSNADAGMDAGTSSDADAGNEPAESLAIPVCAMVGPHSTPGPNAHFWNSEYNYSAGRDGQFPVSGWINVVEDKSFPINWLMEIRGQAPETE